MIDSIGVVEDSEIQCAHAVELCRSLCPTSDIRAYYDGSLAVDGLRSKAVDVILIDLEMPVMDGVLLAKIIAEEKLAKSVVICSAKDPMLISSVAAICEAGGLNVVGVVQKPITLGILYQCFEQHLLSKEKTPELTSSGYKETPPKFSDSELKDAVLNEHIHLYYQPKVTAGGVLLKGLEALARWNHPVYGMIPPTVFVHQAEKSDLIDEMTFSLIKQGLVFIHECHLKGLLVDISFNLSPISISKEGFCEKVDKLVASTGVNQSNIIFELTENILLNDISVALSSLARLRLRGYGVSIDDYGSQYANAEILAKLPVTELKLDRKLVHGVSKTWAQRNILESTVKMAKKLKLITVAEGVETDEDFRIVQNFDVDLVQGYIFSKPLNQSEFIQWVKTDLAILRDRYKKRI